MINFAPVAALAVLIALVVVVGVIAVLYGPVQPPVAYSHSAATLAELEQAILESKCLVAGQWGEVVFGVPLDAVTLKPRPDMAAEVVRNLRVNRYNADEAYEPLYPDDAPPLYTIKRKFVLYLVLHEQEPGKIFLLSSVPGLVPMVASYVVVAPGYEDDCKVY